MTHYFKNDFDSSKELKIEGNVRGIKMEFKTGPGMFSYKELDKWTLVMINNFVTMDIDNSVNFEILDLCSGYGLVCSYLKKKYPNANVSGVDINERACAYAVKNFVSHGGSEENIICKDALEWLPLQEGKYNAIFVNPPFSAWKKTCFGLIDAAKVALKEGWLLYFVAPTNKWAKSYAKYLEEVFWNIDPVYVNRWFRLYKTKKIAAKVA